MAPGLSKQFAVLEALKKGGYLVECLLQDTDLSGVEAPRWTLSYRDFRTGVLKPFITGRIDVLAAFVTEVALEDTPLFLAGFQEVWDDPPDVSTELCIDPQVHKYLLARGGTWCRVHLYLLIATAKLMLEGKL